MKKASQIASELGKGNKVTHRIPISSHRLAGGTKPQCDPCYMYIHDDAVIATNGRDLFPEGVPRKCQGCAIHFRQQ